MFIHIKVNDGNDNMRCYCDANSIFPSPNSQTYYVCLLSSNGIIIDFIKLFLNHHCTLDTF